MFAFPTMTSGDYISVVLVVVTYLQYRSEKKKQNQKEDERHSQNLSKLDALVDFQAEQKQFNEETREQLSSLTTELVKVGTEVEGIDRRVEILERSSR